MHGRGEGGTESRGADADIGGHWKRKGDDAFRQNT